MQLSVLEIPTVRSIDVASTPVANSTRNPMNISDDRDTSILQTLPSRHGKAPPVESFTGKESSVHWDDWLPTLERAAFLPTEPTEYGDILEYRGELTLSLSSAREQAASNIKTAQKKYKEQYDKQANPICYKPGGLVLV